MWDLEIHKQVGNWSIHLKGAMAGAAWGLWEREVRMLGGFYGVGLVCIKTQQYYKPQNPSQWETYRSKGLVMFTWTGKPTIGHKPEVLSGQIGSPKYWAMHGEVGSTIMSTWISSLCRPHVLVLQSHVGPSFLCHELKKPEKQDLYSKGEGKSLGVKGSSFLWGELGCGWPQGDWLVSLKSRKKWHSYRPGWASLNQLSPGCTKLVLAF